jgi:ketosteroid isomerase-like protein
MTTSSRTAPQREVIEQLLHELYAARTSGDLERLCRLFAADAAFKIAGSSDGKPIAIAAQGEREIRTWLGVLVKTFRISHHEMTTTIIDGARAAVQWRARIHSRITGAVVATELIDLLEIRDGRIIAYSELLVPI